MTNDDELGIAWFNSLTEPERRKWLELAGTGRPVDAWEVFKGHGAIAAFIDHAVTEAWAGVAEEPKLVPLEYRRELAQLSRGDLEDVAWYLASLIHDLANDPDGDMIELRCAIDHVQDRRRPSAVTLRKRD
jgi:hypothetical protein